MLQGKKSYVLAAVIAAGAIASLIAGVIDTKECLETLAAAGALASLKSAIVKAEV
tara:strand:- start:2316 stop:2480 length:165 start_codon:yes stop_codon:yes gene_type:complete